MANLRIEFFDGTSRFGGVTLVVTGIATAGGDRPTIPADQGSGKSKARFIADAPVYVAVGSAPNPTAPGASVLVYPGIPVDLEAAPGQLISAITASDINPPTLAALAAGSAIIGKVGIDQTAGQNAVADGGSGIATSWGVAGVPFVSADQHSAVASITDAPTSGQKLVIDDIIVSVDTAMSVTFKEETSGTIIFGPWYLPANSGPVQVTPRGKKKLATANKKLQVITSVAGNITVSTSYHSEA